MRTLPSMVAAAALTLAAALAACGDDAPDGRGGPGAAVGVGAAVAAGATYRPGDTIEFRASEFAFTPMEVVAEVGTYTGRLINDGAVEHDLTLAGSAPVVAAAGETVEFELTVPAD